jgi:ABC-2 type transport system ATP-binding protein
MIWFCGGHGVCGDKAPPAPNPDQEAQINRDTLAWLDQYVAGVPGKAADAIPNFQWYDQQNRYYSSEKFSFDPGFNNPTPRSFTGGGGTLGIVPLLGGSGSSGAPEAFRGTPLAALYRFPFDAFLGITATPANNALSVPVALTPGDQVVGAPHLSFSYSGLGTSRAVFAQIVEAPSKDYPDGRVIGSIVTAVPVTLDGKSHTVSIPLQQIAYTQYANSPALSLQITSSATQFANSSFGVVNIANVRLDLPTRATDNQK